MTHEHIMKSYSASLEWSILTSKTKSIKDIDESQVCESSVSWCEYADFPPQAIEAIESKVVLKGSSASPTKCLRQEAQI